MISCLIAEAVDSKWVEALNVKDMGVNFMMVMVMLPGWKGEKRLHELAECGDHGDDDNHDDGDDGEEKEGLHDFAECETKTSAQSLGKRDVTEGRWDIHGTQI